MEGIRRAAGSGGREYCWGIYRERRNGAFWVVKLGVKRSRSIEGGDMVGVYVVLLATLRALFNRNRITGLP
jgi:hypothetical protein